MGTLKWHKRDHRAALVGMMKLTLEERGAYQTVLDLIYVRDGQLKDDPEEICDWLKCNVRTWRRIRAKLIDLEKLYVHGGCLHNERADEEISAAQHRVKVCSEAAAKRWATYNEIKRLSDGYPMLTTTRKKDLSANVMPIFKGTAEKDRKK